MVDIQEEIDSDEMAIKHCRQNENSYLVIFLRRVGDVGLNHWSRL